MSLYKVKTPENRAGSLGAALRGFKEAPSPATRSNFHSAAPPTQPSANAYTPFLIRGPLRETKGGAVCLEDKQHCKRGQSLLVK